MRQTAPELSPWRATLRRHERGLAVAWLAAVAVVFCAMALTPVRVRLLTALQHAADAWDSRWSDRLAHGEALLADGNPVEAVGYLEGLDRAFPARDVRHARDKERERLLALLARSYEAAGKKGKAMRTFARLVAFDPNNYYSRFQQARAAERLLSGWALAPEARDAYASVLDLFPSHLPSVRGYIDYYMDRGEFIPVVQAYEKYLDAFLIQRIEVGLGDSSGVALVPVDGLPHEVVLPLARPRGWSGDLSLRTRGFAVAVEGLTLDPAPVVGLAERLTPVVLPLLPSSMNSLVAGPRGSYVPLGADPALHFRVPSQRQAVGAVRLRLRLFKPVDMGLWAQVQKSYRNLLEYDGLAAAEGRTAAFPSAADADAVLARLDWAREGQEQALNEAAD